MASTSSIQKAAMSQDLAVAKAVLRGRGAVEAGSHGSKVRTASTATRKAKSTAGLTKRGLRRTRIRI